MPPPSENTSLLSGNHEPEHVFGRNLTSLRKNKVRQFQCCLCALFLTVLLVAIIATVSYSINHSDNSDNSTLSGNQSETSLDSFIVLLTTNWPISDAECKNKTLDDKGKWEESIKAGERSLKDNDDMEMFVPSLPLRSPSYRHQKVVATSERARNLSRVGCIQEGALKHILKGDADSLVDVNQLCYNDSSTTSMFCGMRRIECNRFYKYRSYNGSCNNLKEPTLYGVGYRPFRRALPPDYADGISQPRVAKDGGRLPSARTVSLTVHRPYYKADSKFSVMLAVWGQFLDHDITATALSQKSNGSTISCCTSSSVQFPECFPVELESWDPFGEYNVSCLEFVRSAPAPKCCLGPRDQLNQVTSFIDGSVVYGAEEELVKKLRDFRNGALKMFYTEDGRTLLPISDDLNDGCNREEQQHKGQYCFLTGDPRANENLHLTSMHLLWARQHNLLASQLSKLNPHWDDETVFQEARKILGAQMQHITYNEFLPILLGDKLMEAFALSPQESGYFMKYNESVDPSIANNFATAAFRFAHSIIPGLMKLLANDSSSPEFIQMHKMLFNPFRLYNAGEFDRTLRGAMNTSIESSDSYFTNEMKTHLFEVTAEQVKQPKLCGLDLVSLNVQRGRDHGLPGYSHWRKHCGLRIPTKFDDLKRDFDTESFENVKKIYKDVDDIDLYTGALSERPLKQSLLGPTLTCLILDQFFRLKYGDRFWYENHHTPQAFAPDQLKEIRKTTLANIICDNSDNLDVIQPNVMEGLNPRNKYVYCRQISRPNVTAWKCDLDRLSMSHDSINVIVMNKN